MRRLFTPLFSRSLILMYHRVAEESLDPFRTVVSPPHFAEHLDVITRFGEVLPLNQLARVVRERHVPRRAVAITIDDGYLDALQEARPLLERYDVPATVFVVSGYLDGGRGFWADRLTDLVLRSACLPRTLVLRIAGLEQEWDLGEWAEYGPEAQQRFSHWHNSHRDVPTVRHALFRSVYWSLRALPEEHIWWSLDDLASQIDDGEVSAPTARPMVREEVLRLAEGGLVHVGGHTVTHPDFSYLDPVTTAKEILRGKRDLEGLLEREVISFAYPYGVRSEPIARSVRDAGFDHACGVGTYPVSRRSDLWHLPRCAVEDCDGETLLRRLERWMRL